MYHCGANVHDHIVGKLQRIYTYLHIAPPVTPLCACALREVYFLGWVCTVERVLLADRARVAVEGNTRECA